MNKVNTTTTNITNNNNKNNDDGDDDDHYYFLAVFFGCLMPLFYRMDFTSGLCCLIVGDFLQASPAHIPCPVIIVENFRPAVSIPNLKTWKLPPHAALPESSSHCSQ